MRPPLVLSGDPFPEDVARDLRLKPLPGLLWHEIPQEQREAYVEVRFFLVISRAVPKFDGAQVTEFDDTESKQIALKNVGESFDRKFHSKEGAVSTVVQLPKIQCTVDTVIARGQCFSTLIYVRNI